MDHGHAIEKTTPARGANTGYWGAVREAWRTLTTGLRLSWRHFRQARRRRPPMGVEDNAYFEYDTGIVTLQYPKEQIPVPDHGRYQLHNEIEDCIVCDKCAKVCPVDCIDIEPIRSAEEIGKTSDGTSRRIYAAKFDIDMAKCCFCGLCTTVCPTECLTMTSEYDFSVFDLKEHTFSFAEMTEQEIAEKQRAWDRHQAEKEAQKSARAASGPGAAKPKAASPKPKPKPTTASTKNPTDEAAAKAKALMDRKKQEEDPGEDAPKANRPKPVYRPKVPTRKPKPPQPPEGGETD